MKVATVYRMFDQYGRLLYVGQTVQLGRRITQHMEAQPWWTEVAEITCEHFETERAAAHAEARAIDKENPLHNRRRRLTLTSQRRTAPVESLEERRLRTMYRVPGGIECQTCGWEGNWIQKGRTVEDVACPECETRTLAQKVAA